MQVLSYFIRALVFTFLLSGMLLLTSLEQAFAAQRVMRQCDFNSDCAVGFVCSPAGYCTNTACREQRDCPAGLTCEEQTWERTPRGDYRFIQVIGPVQRRVDSTREIIVDESGIQRSADGTSIAIAMPSGPYMHMYFCVQQRGPGLSRATEVSPTAPADDRSVGADRSPAAPQAGFFEMNIDRPGGDLRSIDLRDARPEACRDLCLAEPACRSWTYVKPSKSPFALPFAKCWLKNAVPASVPSDCCISGIR